MRLTLFVFWFYAFVLSSQAQQLNYYFGNLHAHTGFSDGNKDSLTSGVSKPDGSYAYAKLSQDFDFLGISEHNHFSNQNNPGFEIQNYQIGLNMANAANQDGTFSALFGIEYGVSSNNNGHVIIYGFNQLLGWETGNYDIFNAKSDYDGLFLKVKNNPNAFCYLAHPYDTDFSTNGGWSGSLANAPYNAAYDSAIVGVPLRSGLAFSTANNYAEYSIGNYMWYFKKLLFKGYHIGMGYDHDNHYTNFGRSNGGRLVILAPSLTPSNITMAMQQMHFYGSDDSNAKIDFKINGNIMGSVFSGTVLPSIEITHADPDGETADSIKIWRGSAPNDTAKVIHASLSSNTTLFVDATIQVNKEYHYFAEIKQADGQWIVTSPVWYTGVTPLSVMENKTTFQFHFFPNPVNKQLHLSTTSFEPFEIIVADLSGRKVFQAGYNQQDISIDLSQLKSGVYTLSLLVDGRVEHRKLVID